MTAPHTVTGHTAGIADVLPEGMVPWNGGDWAPADWDEGEVYMREGRILRVTPDCAMWDHTRHHGHKRFDIIGYTRATAARQSNDMEGEGR